MEIARWRQNRYSFEGGKWRSHLADQSITTIYQSTDNHLWSGGARGLCLFDETTGWQQKLALTAKANCIYQLADGTMRWARIMVFG